MYNFQLLLHNYAFNENDVRILKELSPLARTNVDDFLILFYKRIFTFEHASHFLSNDTIIQRHRRKIRAWFLRLFNSIYDEAYFEMLHRISQTHVRIALPNHYVNAALHVVRSFLREMLISHQRIDALKSVDKLIDMHIDALSGIYNATEQTDILKTIKTIHQSLHKEGKGVIPYVQPIFNARTLQLDKYECLMRIKDINEIILPFKFIEIAQKTGLYCDLSRLMMSKVLDFFSEREEAFNINLSFEDVNEYMTKDFLEKWNDPTILDTLETVNLVDNDQIKYQEEKVIPWQINYTQTSSNKRLSTKLSKMVIPLKILHKDWECILIRSKHG